MMRSALYHFVGFLMGLVLWSLAALPSQAQDNDATKAYQAQPLVTNNGFDNATWQSKTKNLRYTVRAQSTVIRPQQVNNPPPPSGRRVNQIDGKALARTLLFLLGLILVVFVLYRLIGGNAVLTNRGIERRKPVRLEDIETNLQEADVESFLDKAIREGQHRLAIRLYYLAIIKQLAQKGYIQWKKEKTNGQYLRELRQRQYPKTKDFRDATRIFERVWYSTLPFDGGQFKEVRLNFDNLLNTLK